MHDFRPRKIALFTSFPLDLTTGSGVVRMILGYAAAFKKLGHTVKIFHPDFEPSSYLNLAVQRLNFNRKMTGQNFKAFDLFIGSDFDGFALNNLPIPKIVLNAGILADIVRFEQGKIAKILKHLAKRECQNVQNADFTVVPSQYTARQIIRHYGKPAGEISVIPLGIDLQQWEQWKNRTKVIPQKEMIILAVARQYPRKGIHDLILAFKKVVAVKANTRLILVGGGPEFEKNKSLATKLDLSGKITFIGDLKDQIQLANFYRNAHIFCLPSYHETFGLVFLEAMYFGLPIVTYASTAIPEVVTSQQGYLCPVGDIDSLSKKLLTLVQNAELRKRFGLNGQQRVKKFSWLNSARQLLELFNFSPGIDNLQLPLQRDN